MADDEAINNLAFLETIIRYTVSVTDIDAKALQDVVVEDVNKEAGEMVMTTTVNRSTWKVSHRDNLKKSAGGF